MLVCFILYGVLHTIFYRYYFVEDVNSWMRGTHEFHENWATTNSNDSTVHVHVLLIYVFSMYSRLIWYMSDISRLYWPQILLRPPLLLMESSMWLILGSANKTATMPEQEWNLSLSHQFPRFNFFLQSFIIL
mgnify:CR=1 FL=1